MNRTTPGPAQLEWLLAGTLHYGTSLASAVIGLGLGLAWINSRFGGPKPSILRDMYIVTIGIALFILLPVVRVTVMFIVYLRQRDYRLAAIALLVLTIILLGFTVGLAGSRHGDTPTSPAQVGGKLFHLKRCELDFQVRRKNISDFECLAVTKTVHEVKAKSSMGV